MPVDIFDQLGITADKAPPIEPERQPVDIFDKLGITMEGGTAPAVIKNNSRVIDNEASYIEQDKNPYAVKISDNDKRIMDNPNLEYYEKKYIIEKWDNTRKAELVNSEPKGFIEGLKDKGWEHIIPYYGAGQDIAEASFNLNLIDKANSGDKAAEMQLTQMVNDILFAKGRGTSIGGSIGTILHDVPDFVVEMVVALGSMGVGTTPKAASIATKEVAKNAINKEVEERVKESAIKTAAKDFAYKAPFAIPAAAMSPGITSRNYLDRRIAGSIAFTDKGELIFKDNEESPFTTAAKALAEGTIEIGSEMAGGVISEGINIAATPVKKAIGNAIAPVTTKIASKLSPKAIAARNAIFGEIMKLKPDANISKMLADKIYFNGLIAELGEERLADIMKVAVGLNDEDKPTTDKLLDAMFPSKEQWLAEIGAISIFGVASHATAKGIKILTDKGFPQENARRIMENMPETARDDFVKKLEESQASETEENLDNQSIIKITGDELGEYTNDADLRKKGYDYFQKELQGKTVYNKALGAIRLVRKGINKVKSTSANTQKIKLIPKLKEIIETAEYLRTEENTKPRTDNIVRFHYLSNTISLDGKNMDVIVNIAEDREGNFFYNINEDNKKTSLRDTDAQSRSDKDVLNMKLSPSETDVNTEFKDALPYVSDANVENVASEAEFKISPFAEYEETTKSKMLRKFVDRLAPVKPFGEKLYKATRMFSGIGGIISEHINNHTRDLQGNITGEGLKVILKDFRSLLKKSAKEAEFDLSKYLVAKRFLALEKRDDVKVTLEQLQKAKSDLKELEDKYGVEFASLQMFADRIYEYQKRTSHLLVESGLMSENAYNDMLERNPDYVPFNRILEDERIETKEYASGGKMINPRKVIKKIKGSELNIQNVFQSMVNNSADIITNARKNVILQAIARSRRALPSLVKERTPERATYDQVLTDKIKLAIKELGGKYNHVKGNIEGNPTYLGVYKPLENEIKTRIGANSALAHEFGHMLDEQLGLGEFIFKTNGVIKELENLARERLGGKVKMENGRLVTDIKDADPTFMKYIYSGPELIANLYDAYVNAPELLKAIAPKAKKALGNFIDKSEHKWLGDIHASLSTGLETIYGELEKTPNVIAYYQNGRRKYIEVHPDLYEALKGADPNKIPSMLKFVDFALLSGPAKLLRYGATQANIVFAVIRNPIRDTFTAAIQSKASDVKFTPIIDTLKGARHSILKDKDYQDWKAHGGSFDSFMQIRDNSEINPYKDLFESGLKPKYFNPLTLVEKLGSIFEEGTRIGVYNKALKAGKDPDEATYISRDATVDFAKGGTTLKKINQYLPFVNASFQGQISMAEKFKKHPLKMTMLSLELLTLPALAYTFYYAYAASDDEKKKYKEIPAYIKNTNWVFFIDGKQILIPKPFAYGAVFATIPQAIIDGSLGDIDVEWKDIAKNVFDNLNIIGDASGVIPPAIKLMMELSLNKDFYSGKDIIPSYLVDVDDTKQYIPDKTSETLKDIADKLGISPIKLQYSIETLGAGMVKDIVRLVDGIRSNKELPEKELGEKAILRGFIGKEPIGYNSRSVQTFLDKFADLEKAHNTYNRLKDNDPESVDEFVKNNEARLAAYDMMNEANKTIKKMGNAINKIAKSEGLDGKEKKKQMDEIREQMTEVAKDALQQLKQTGFISGK